MGRLISQRSCWLSSIQSHFGGLESKHLLHLIWVIYQVFARLKLKGKMRKDYQGCMFCGQRFSSFYIPKTDFKLKALQHLALVFTIEINPILLGNTVVTNKLNGIYSVLDMPPRS